MLVALAVRSLPGLKGLLVRGIVLGAAAALAACTPTRGGNVPYGVKDFGRPDAPIVDVTQVYRVGPGDILTINIYRVPNLSGDLQVDPLGNIVMPLIGSVPVQGKSSNEITADLVKRLGDKYLQSPEIQVTVKESQSARVTVDGEVQQPGVFPIAGTTSLLQMVALAKGTTDDANPRRVVVFRTVGGQRMAAAFDLTTIRDGAEPDPVIYGSDIIVVGGSKAHSRFKDILSTVPLIALFRPF